MKLSKHFNVVEVEDLEIEYTTLRRFYAFVGFAVIVVCVGEFIISLI